MPREGGGGLGRLGVIVKLENYEIEERRGGESCRSWVPFFLDVKRESAELGFWKFWSFVIKGYVIYVKVK